MKYFDWDRLRLDKGFEAGNLIFKNSVRCEFFRTYRKKVAWDAVSHNNMAFFYGNLTSQRDIFLENFAKQLEKFQESVAIDLYDLSGELLNLGEILENNYKVFNYHNYLNTFETFVDDVLDFRESIRKKNIDKGQIEASDRKLQFILIYLNEQLVHDLEDQELSKKVENLIVDSNWERICFVPITASCRTFNDELHTQLDWAAYLGSENDDYLHNLYSDLEDSYYSRQQKVIGSLFDKTLPKICILHPLKFTPSDFHFEVENRFKEEDELYEKFLQTLDPGE